MPAPPLLKRDWQKDHVYLIQFPRAGCIPSLSPFALKLETWLRMAGIQYSVSWQWLFSTSSSDSVLFVRLLKKKEYYICTFIFVYYKDVHCLHICFSLLCQTDFKKKPLRLQQFFPCCNEIFHYLRLIYAFDIKFNGITKTKNEFGLLSNRFVLQNLKKIIPHTYCNEFISLLKQSFFFLSFLPKYY